MFKNLMWIFFAISGHKPSHQQVGAIYIKEKYLKDIKPYQTGGATIHKKWIIQVQHYLILHINLKQELKILLELLDLEKH